MIKDARWTFVGVIISIGSILLVIIPVFIVQIIIALIMIIFFCTCIYWFRRSRQEKSIRWISPSSSDLTNYPQPIPSRASRYTQKKAYIPLEEVDEQEAEIYDDIPIPFSAYFQENTPLLTKLLCVTTLIISLLGFIIYSFISVISNVHQSYNNSIGYSYSPDIIDSFNAIETFSLTIFFISFTLFLIFYVYNIFKRRIYTEVVIFKGITCSVILMFLGIILKNILPDDLVSYYSTGGRVDIYFSTKSDVNDIFGALFVLIFIIIIIAIISKAIEYTNSKLRRFLGN